MNDNLVSIPILSSLALIIRHLVADQRPEGQKKTIPWGIVLSGALAGIAAGGKLTCAGFSLSLLIFVLASRRFDRRQLAIWIAASFLGFVAAGGWWMIFLYEHYRNPLFPFYNKYFKSEYWLVRNYLDRRFMCKSGRAILVRAFQMIDLKESRYACELQFRDARFAILEVITGFLIVRLVVLAFLRKKPGELTATIPYLLFCCASYILTQ